MDWIEFEDWLDEIIFDTRPSRVPQDVDEFQDITYSLVPVIQEPMGDRSSRYFTRVLDEETGAFFVRQNNVSLSDVSPLDSTSSSSYFGVSHLR